MTGICNLTRYARSIIRHELINQEKKYLAFRASLQLSKRRCRICISQSCSAKAVSSSRLAYVAIESETGGDIVFIRLNPPRKGQAGQGMEHPNVKQRLQRLRLITRC